MKSKDDEIDTVPWIDEGDPILLPPNQEDWPSKEEIYRRLGIDQPEEIIAMLNFEQDVELYRCKLIKPNGKTVTVDEIKEWGTTKQVKEAILKWDKKCRDWRTFWMTHEKEIYLDGDEIVFTIRYVGDCK